MDKKTIDRVDWLLENEHYWKEWNFEDISRTDAQMRLSTVRTNLFHKMQEYGLYSNSTSGSDVGLMRLVRMAWDKKNKGLKSHE
jgi:hypothetical protein